MMMTQSQTVAYLRVSTADQDIEKNKADILHLANDKDLGRIEWVEEYASGRKTPKDVLAWVRGRHVELAALRQLFRQVRFSRSINRQGFVSIQRFYIYAERGLSRQRVSIWIYEGTLRIEYQQTLLAQYQCQVDRSHQVLTTVNQPSLYQTSFRSPQPELFELDDEQWLKIYQRPHQAQKRSSPR